MKLKELLEIATVPDGCDLIYSDCDGLCVTYINEMKRDNHD